MLTVLCCGVAGLAVSSPAPVVHRGPYGRGSGGAAGPALVPAGDIERGVAGALFGAGLAVMKPCGALVALRAPPKAFLTPRLCFSHPGGTKERPRGSGFPRLDQPMSSIMSGLCQWHGHVSPNGSPPHLDTGRARVNNYHRLERYLVEPDDDTP